MNEIISVLVEYGPTILAVYGGLVTIATAVTKATPTPKDDEVLGKILSWTSKVIEMFSTVKRK